MSEAAADGDRNPSARVLPWVSDEPPARPYGARSDQSVLVGDLLMRYVPALARGDLEIVAIARRPGALSKVAVRRRAGVRLAARPVSLVVGLGTDYVHASATSWAANASTSCSGRAIPPGILPMRSGSGICRPSRCQPPDGSPTCCWATSTYAGHAAARASICCSRRRSPGGAFA